MPNVLNKSKIFLVLYSNNHVNLNYVIDVNFSNNKFSFLLNVTILYMGFLGQKIKKLLLFDLKLWEV